VKQLMSILLCIFASMMFFNVQNVNADEIVQSGKVTGLIAKHKDHSVSLDWDFNRDVNYYVVERNGIVLTSNATHYYIDEHVGDDITYTYTVYPVGSDEKTSNDIYIEKDVSAPDNIDLIKTIVGNSFIEFSWYEPSNDDYTGVYVYFSNGNRVDFKKGEKAFRIVKLTEGKEYTYTFCAHDGSGNEVPIEKCIKATNTTTTDHDTPPEVTNLKVNYDFELYLTPTGNIQVVNEGLYVTWSIPNIDDYYGAYVTLPNNQKVFVKGTRYIYDAKFVNKYFGYRFYVQTVDHNGNVSKGSFAWWDDPKRAPGSVTNQKLTVKNGVTTITFTPPSDLDYARTIINLPDGTTFNVYKGKNSHSYKTKLKVGQINEFKLRAFDKDNNSSAEKVLTYVPSTKPVNKYTVTRTIISIRSLPDNKGKALLSVKRNNKIKILSRDYGIKKNYLFVQSGTIKGYIPKTAVK